MMMPVRSRSAVLSDDAVQRFVLDPAVFGSESSIKRGLLDI